MILIGGCHSSHKIVFAGHEWKVNDSTKYVHDKNMNWVFTVNSYDFSNRDPLLGSDIAISRYPGLSRYLSGVLADTEIDIDTVLLYIPTHHLVFATYKGDDTALPAVAYIPFLNDSIASNEKKPRAYVNLFGQTGLDVEDKWMLINTSANTGKKRSVVAYRFPYLNRKLVMLKILQAETPEANKINDLFVPFFDSPYVITKCWIDPSDPKFTQIVGWEIERGERTALMNLNIGERLKKIIF
ncbi:MAG: hypothetical protein K2M10_04395 [Muribaculaceae bacterium]|nr:hypothetical protein [Muribaculaceae bacterium]